MNEKQKRILSMLAHDSSQTITTNDVTLATELSNDQVRYQFQELTEQGLIETEVRDEGQFAVTYATLTDSGREEIAQRNVTLLDRVEDHEEALSRLILTLHEEDVVEWEEAEEYV